MPRSTSRMSYAPQGVKGFDDDFNKIPRNFDSNVGDIAQTFLHCLKCQLNLVMPRIPVMMKNSEHVLLLFQPPK